MELLAREGLVKLRGLCFWKPRGQLLGACTTRGGAVLLRSEQREERDDRWAYQISKFPVDFSSPLSYLQKGRLSSSKNYDNLCRDKMYHN